MHGRSVECVLSGFKGVDAIDLGRLVGYLNPSVSNINVHTLHLPILLLVFSLTINVAWYYIVTYPVTLAQPVYTPVYVSFISCSMSPQAASTISKCS